MIPFYFQDFGSFSLSLFGILYEVGSLSLPLLFGLVGIYPVPLPAGYSSVSSLVYIAVFGVVFLYSGSLWSSLYCGVFFIVEFPHCGWGSLGGLSLCRCSGGWSWISSLWSAMKCPVMSYEMSMGLE